MATESVSPSYWPIEWPESTPTLLELNESGESSPYSHPWSPDSQPRWPDVHPWLPESVDRSPDVQRRSPVVQPTSPVTQSYYPESQPVSQSWPPDLRVFPTEVPVSPEPPPTKIAIGSLRRRSATTLFSSSSRRRCNGSDENDAAVHGGGPYLDIGCIPSKSVIGSYSRDSLDSELPWGEVVPDTLDSEGGDYYVPESIITDGHDDACLKMLGLYCPAVLTLLDKN